ncbi:MAG TPA: shikimate kinase [Planctomicrobium sp.]|nr:shikimate kinase [Planctomicrobium sp.]
MAISLIGYRGTGKTTVGAALAERLNWKFIDLDPIIEQQSGMTIAQIFEQHGEPHFRMLESNALQQALSQGNVVVSPGGGAILDSSNQGAMQGAGPVVWLVASVETIMDRLASDPATVHSRPSLTGSDALSEIADVLNVRTPIYNQAATITVSTENRTPASIVDEIVGQLD